MLIVEMSCSLTIVYCSCFSTLCFDFLTLSLSIYVVLSNLTFTAHFFLLFLWTFLTLLSSSLYSLCVCLALIIHFLPSTPPTIISTSHFPPTHPYFHHYLLVPPPLSDVRLRVRAEYLEHESALRGSVSSDKRQPLERQFELFSQASSLLHSRDLGSIVCDIRFTELENLEAFWSDYLSGALLEALKGVFITDSLRMAAGMEGVCLLISVDQDDYEEGRKLLGARKGLSSGNGGRTGTHWAL